MENSVLRKRFVSDYNLPIQVLQNPYFEEYLERYEPQYGTLTKWNMLIEMVNTHFNGNPEEWLSYYAKVRDNIINTIENSEPYKVFCNCDMSQYLEGAKQITVGDVNIYNESNVGRVFISIDLRKANFQALNLYDKNILLNSETYDDFINNFTDVEYIKESKYTRQVIFGKLNPKRTVQIEKYIMSQIAQSGYPLIREIEACGGKLISFKSDELVYDVTDVDEAIIGLTLEDMVQKLKTEKNIDVRIEYFGLNLLKFYDHREHTIPVYEKEMYNTPQNELKQAPQTFFPQIHRIYNGETVQENDLVFYHEHQLAKFMYPIYLKTE